jgi:L,D-peptidoglycan transpeptidase YkuD (ErfK/YbiS/YcfS/YnhG family)
MKLGTQKSFEYMKREDDQYYYGIVVAHNKEAKKGRGSCIFIHVEKEHGAGSAGCTTMKRGDLEKILKLLKRDKNPILIQIPSRSSKEILNRYPQLKNSHLLK